MKFQASKVLISQLILLTVCFSATSALSCQDENGNDVDWYVLYKIPQLASVNPDVKSGNMYMYLQPTSSSWTISKWSVNDTQSFLSQTLQPLYKKNDTKIMAKVLYNDEHQDGAKTLILGHTKGVVAFEESNGFWLIHSVPKFPPRTNESYAYPNSGEVYGQSFLCISLDFSAANKIGGLLMYNEPFIYDSFISDSVSASVPWLESVVNNKHVAASPWNQTIILESLAKFPFQAFAKYKNYDKDLYSSWVAQFFQTDLVTETWQNGPNKLPSECSDVYTVENVLEMSVPYLNITFKSTHDHSKLAVSKMKENPWVCIGDINRMKPQKRRGGGTVCLKNAVVWNAFYSMVVTVQTCSGTGNFV